MYLTITLLVVVVVTFGTALIFVLSFKKAFGAPQSSATAPLRVGRIHEAHLRCPVCSEPLKDGDIVCYRDGETPWHVHHKGTK